MLYQQAFYRETRLHLLHHDTFRRLCRARDVMASDFRASLVLERAAQEACYSPFHFHRLFRDAFGETPHQFLTRRRLDHAKRLLASGEMTVTEVCLDCGYESLGSFSTKFRMLSGRTPTEYQREVRRVFGFMAPWRIAYMPMCFLGHFGGMNS